MKKLLATTALSLMSFGALAADLPARVPALAPAPVFVVAAPAWAGFYVGAHAGYAVTKPRYTEADADFNTNPKMDGFVFGPYAGYNFQSGSVVFGIEADASFGSLKAGANPNNPDNNYSAFDQKWSGNVRARLGYAFGSALLYVAGGVAFADIKVDDVEADWGSASKTHVGWTIGAGVDYAFTSNWIARAEYLYSDFGRDTFNIAFEGIPNYDASVKPQSHTFRVGIAYKFGGAPVARPVVARY
jgi:outer membrane immunogenic protein